MGLNLPKLIEIKPQSFSLCDPKTKKKTIRFYTVGYFLNNDQWWWSWGQFRKSRNTPNLLNLPGKSCAWLLDNYLFLQNGALKQLFQCTVRPKKRRKIATYKNNVTLWSRGAKVTIRASLENSESITTNIIVPKLRQVFFQREKIGHKKCRNIGRKM